VDGSYFPQPVVMVPGWEAVRLWERGGPIVLVEFRQESSPSKTVWSRFDTAKFSLYDPVPFDLTSRALEELRYHIGVLLRTTAVASY
jgi:hypothetical protein